MSRCMSMGDHDHISLSQSLVCRIGYFNTLRSFILIFYFAFNVVCLNTHQLLIRIGLFLFNIVLILHYPILQSMVIVYKYPIGFRALINNLKFTSLPNFNGTNVLFYHFCSPFVLILNYVGNLD